MSTPTPCNCGKEIAKAYKHYSWCSTQGTEIDYRVVTKTVLGPTGRVYIVHANDPPVPETSVRYFDMWGRQHPDSKMLARNAAYLKEMERLFLERSPPRKLVFDERDVLGVEPWPVIDRIVCEPAPHDDVAIAHYLDINREVEWARRADFKPRRAGLATAQAAASGTPEPTSMHERIGLGLGGVWVVENGRELWIKPGTFRLDKSLGTNETVTADHIDALESVYLGKTVTLDGKVGVISEYDGTGNPQDWTGPPKTARYRDSAPIVKPNE